MKILITKVEDVLPFELKEEHLQKIKEIAPDSEIIAAIGSKEIENNLETADVFLTFPNVSIDLDKAKNLKWIHSFSAGVDGILTPQVASSAVLLSNSSGVHPVPISEHVLCFLLSFARKFNITFRQQLEKKWQRIETLTELRGKAVLVIGLGNIGREVIRLCKCLGLKTMGVDRNKNELDSLDEFHSPENLPEILPNADFVVLCLPHTKETHHFLNKEKLERMKKEAILINIGRGGVVNEEELIQALKDGRIAGAGLDVTEKEPLPEESPLWDMEQVIITPHHSGWSEKYMDRAIDIFCQNLKNFLEGKPLSSLVDKTKGY
ncbi:MAG: D-2-hydroxyacid dehydrogenase [bacterium]